MTREQILNTAMEIYNKPIKNFTSEHGDFDGVLEYLDGAIRELVSETAHMATNMTIERLLQKFNDELS